jgi:TPR repeat protein
MFSKFTNRVPLVLIAVVLMVLLLISAAHKSISSSAPIDIAQDSKLSSEEKFSRLANLAYSENKDPKALFLLYNMLYHGQGTPVSTETALIMLKKSANAGYPVAQEELGFIFLHGTAHYEKDLSLAYHWLNKAAKSGMAKSKKYLHSSS